MTLWKDLADQARHLATKERKRPKQASLRRAISAAYYALFHHLIDEAARFLISGTAEREALRLIVGRAFDHAEMKRVSKAFSSGNPPQVWRPALRASSLPGDLRDVAEAFVELQEARHQADYDLSRRYARREVMELVRRAESAQVALSRCRKNPATEAFLVALLLNRHVRS